ncbi:MAG: YdcF family protein [Burkholderiaceae bacterium]
MFKPHQLIALAATLLLAGFVGTAYRIVRRGAEESGNSADSAIVLGAAAWGNRPSPVYRERINQAVALYQQGRVRVIIFTGGTRRRGYPSEAEVGRQFAESKGVPPRSILVDMDSRTTWENLAHAKVLMASGDLHSALLVSDPLHMQRAEAMAIDLGIHVEPAPTLSSRFVSLTTRGKFLWRETWLYLGYRLFGQAS